MRGWTLAENVKAKRFHGRRDYDGEGEMRGFAGRQVEFKARKWYGDPGDERDKWPCASASTRGLDQSETQQ
ncbi:hypothetical protein MHYP_G00225240 [Metynnis hypsauchen]